MAGLFSAPQLPSVQAPPPVPALADATVSKAAADAQRSRALAQGRASTYLTDPQTQQTPDRTQQRYLGMA